VQVKGGEGLIYLETQLAEPEPNISAGVISSGTFRHRDSSVSVYGGNR